MSFGFVCTKDDWQDVAGQLIRTVQEALLFEISVVGQPAYTASSVDLRSLPEEFRSRVKKDDEDDCDCDPDDDDCDCDDEDNEEDMCLSMRAAQQCTCGMKSCMSLRSGDDEEDRARRLELLARRY